MVKLNEHVTCADGFSMSVQANAGAYCSPRIDNADKYTAVEVGFPSQYEPMLMEWCDGGEPLNTIYGWVPTIVVMTVCAKHGGVVSGDLPPGVVELKAVG